MPPTSHAAWLAAGGGSGPIQSKTVTLTHAQILALPTTPVEIVAAPGANKLIVVQRAVLRANFAAAAYTNVSVNDNPNLSGLSLAYGDDNDQASGFVLFQHLGAFDKVVVLHPLAGGAAAHTSVDGGFDWQFPLFDASISLLDQHIQLEVYNESLGDFTGGDAANTLKVVVLYAVVDLA